MPRSAAVALLLALACQQSCGTEVTVTDKDNKTCIYAQLNVNFTVTYLKKNGTNGVAEFVLPEKVQTVGSSCGVNNSVLNIGFGRGHNWTVDFSLKGPVYQADSIVFVYNLSDSSTFPDSKTNETRNVTVHPWATGVSVGTYYSCKSEEPFAVSPVNQTLWNVEIQAFFSGNVSKNSTVCVADQSTTTVTPTTHTTTTPVTNTTVPVTTTAVPATTTTPTPTLPTPTTGNYTVSPGVNRTACLLANLGLRIGVKSGDKYEEVNLDPNATNASGSCGDESRQLVLTSDTMNITFTFTNDTKKFRLHAFTATGKTRSGMSFSEGNDSLSLWEASLSSSYMCNKEQNYSINDALTLFTFNLHVQPFGVSNSAFSTAHECAVDDVSILVPVIVGCVLAGLIVIVVVAYLIGRRKTHAGYQTL